MSFLPAIHPLDAARCAAPAACEEQAELRRLPGVSAEEFRDGIFALRTRRFGRVAEIMVARLTGAEEARNIFHDLFDADQSARIEVKFCTVGEKHEQPITEASLFDAVAQAARPRAVSFAAWENARFDCNIQQVKPEEFDVLFYGLFFHDRIVIFQITRDELLSDPAIRYCPRQHKGNVGEGQFHLNQRTLGHHLAHYHQVSLTYGDFLVLLSPQGKSEVCL